ncbi:hypothetical protein NUW58_g10388 [Xylaria curta]|uniref:Uncharacterized protein n=1 Tax=Xylaria curta TaxID=42375 RepID=A0ACC1MLL3_9PEZI|nr:hypothetical protein NUW58_g10388 [Xylaria curta]
MATPQLNGLAEPDQDLVPSTPPEAIVVSPVAHIPSLNRLSSSQQSIPSTEVPASPADPSTSFQTELNDDRLSPPPVIRSIPSPPATTLHILHQDHPSIADYVPPHTDQIDNATVDELRSMLQSSLSINAKLKSETAHHNLQYKLLSLQASEDAKRANVEHEMTRREVEALRSAEHTRQARRELETRVDPIQIKYHELQQAHDALIKEHDDLLRRFKSASRLVQQQAEEIDVLNEDREMLLNRIRENRQHFHINIE